MVESFLADEPTSADIEAASHKLSEAALYLKGIIQDRMNREKPEALSENAHDSTSKQPY